MGSRLMATVAATRLSPQAPATAPVGAHDRLFYGGMAIELALTVLTGFAPTYYLRFFGDGPRATVSGALHRRLRVAGAVLAAAMILAGMSVAIAAARGGSAPPGMDPLAFLAVPFFDMVLFATFVTTALVMRRDKEAHKRLMLLAYISLIVAAVARLPGVLPLGPLAFFGLGYVFVVLAAIYDFVSRRRVHKAYLWGGGLMVASVPLRLMISGTGAWRGFAELLTK
jgi:FtsH-binding integral membrane protein